ncbi:MAG: hypothetical protein JSU96_17215 [Acidobacteriota bacterium]|nr:MAG: hypothetical protein JSU96_17215 [Acidobacteriota bacterium]
MGKQVQVVDASSKLRWLVAALMLVLVGLGIWASLYVAAEVAKLEGLAVDEPERAVQEMERLLRLVGLALLMTTVVLAAILAYIAFRTHRAGQYPPPGALVVRTVTVIRGRKATLRAWIGYLLAVLLLSSGVFLAWFCFNLIDFLESGGC